MFAPQVLADVAGELLTEPAGGDAFEAAGWSGNGGLRRVVHQEVDVIACAVELPQFRSEVGTHLAHDRFAVLEDVVGEWAAPVLRGEDQVRVEGVDNRTAPCGCRGLAPVEVT